MNMDDKSQIRKANSLQTTSAGGNCTSQDSVSHVLSSSLDDQGNSQSISMAYSSQASPGIENSVVTPNLQSLNSPSMLPSLTVLAETTEPHGAGASYNLHNVSGVSQNSVVYASGQCPQSSILASSQRQMQGRQHVQHVVAQQHQQLTQKASEYVYQQHLHNHILKQSSHGNMQPSTLQSHIHQPHHHQHDSLQQAQLQPSGPSFLRCSSGPQSSSSTHQQPQSSLMQSSPQFAFKQNQQSSGQQFKSSVLQQPLQSVIQQHQQSQQSLHQQQSVPLQTMISIQQNQQLMGKPPDEAKIHQNEMLGQSNNVPSGWHRQEQPWLSYQKNNIPKQQQHQHFLALPNEVQNLHQQYLGQQSNVSGTKQQQFFGSQSRASNMSLHQHSVHIMQRAKVPEEQQQTTPILFPTQGLESQSNSSKQQIISKFQMELAHLDLQKHPMSVHRDMHQGLHNSNVLLESETMTKRQRQMFQQPKMCSKASSASTNALAMTGRLKNADEAEEVYQRFKTMKRMHLPALKDILPIILKHQQQATKPEQSERLKQCKASVEYFLQLLQMDENNISFPKEKLDMVEKHIIYLIIMFRPKGSLSHQQPQTFGDHHQQSQGQHHENQMNTPMQPRNLKSAMTSMQPNGVASMHHSSMPFSVNHMGASALQTDVTHTLQSGSNLESRHHNTPSSVQLQQNNAASLQKITMNANQQAQMNVSTQNCMNAWQPNVHLLQQNNNVLHNQRMRQQEQQQLQTQQLKQQLQHCQMSLQFIQQQEQQQNMQLHQQLKQQQWTQPLSHQMPQLRQTSEVKDMKGRPVMGVKLEKFSPHSASQHSAHENQSLKTGSPFSISSPQPSQAASPQVSQNSSPQIHQQIMSSSLSKAGTPLQSANSPAVTPSPSPSLTPSPAQGNLETQSTGVSPLPNAGNSGEQQTVLPPQVHSIIIGTPGISASPLLSESTGMDSNQVIAPTNGSGKPSIIEQPHQRLFKVIKAMAPELFGSSVSDVGLVDSTVDTMHKSIQDKRYIMSVSKNTVTKRSLLRELTLDDAFSATKKIKCQSVAMPMNIVSSDGSTNDEVAAMKGHGIQEPWSTAMSKAYNSMIQEIREINQKLLTTVVDIVNEDGKLTSNPSGDGKGIIVRCSFTALAVCPDMKSQHFPSQILPVLHVQLLVLTNYPHSSPVLLDTCPVNLSKEYELLFMKAKSLFTRSLRCLSQPMSVGVMAKSWDACARAAMLEYAQANGGGSFCTRYGTWQNCVDTI